MKKDTYPPDRYPKWVLCERAKLKQASHKIECVVDMIESTPAHTDELLIMQKELLKAITILHQIYETN